MGRRLWLSSLALLAHVLLLVGCVSSVLRTDAAPARTNAAVGDIEGEVALVAPIVIAHRGACGYAPEHTELAYDLAMQFKADFVEMDVVPTKGQFVHVRPFPRLLATRLQLRRSIPTPNTH